MSVLATAMRLVRRDGRDKTCQAHFCRLQLRVAQKVPGTVLSRQPASPRPTRTIGDPVQGHGFHSPLFLPKSMEICQPA